jgi:hypothetical protein
MIGKLDSGRPGLPSTTTRWPIFGVAELIHQRGDLFLLAEEIRSRLTRPLRDVRLAAQGVA